MMYSNVDGTEKRDGARDGLVTVQATPAGTVAANPQGNGYYNAQGRICYFVAYYSINSIFHLQVFMFNTTNQ